jgi:mannose-6-phosphate isomerase-like protein (cupin superfamily)
MKNQPPLRGRRVEGFGQLKTLQGETAQTTKSGRRGIRPVSATPRQHHLRRQILREKPAGTPPDGEEFVLFVEGMATLNIVSDDEPPQSFEVSAGMIAIVPKGAWHRVHDPDGMTVITVTPGQTEFVQLDVDDPRIVEPQRR